MLLVQLPSLPELLISFRHNNSLTAWTYQPTTGLTFIFKKTEMNNQVSLGVPCDQDFELSSLLRVSIPELQLQIRSYSHFLCSGLRPIPHIGQKFLPRRGSNHRRTPYYEYALNGVTTGQESYSNINILNLTVKNMKFVLMNFHYSDYLIEADLFLEAYSNRRS